jgi:3-hydroxyacyl-CoA dehydrogenase/enoyl-CoA hydratase/3-hydroxybutyryl-CoA epimerase
MQTEADRLEHWRSATCDAGIRWLTIDKANSGANTLDTAVLIELDCLLDRARNDGVTGLVIRSGKQSGFIVGADIKEFQGLQDADEGAAAASRGQAVLQKLADFPAPTVAAIAGFALGGGLELALACDYRLAVEGYERNLGLPEVQLGIHPGFGGTVRAVQLLGAPLALDLMLSGRMLSPVEAVKARLVDRIVAADTVDSTARELIAGRPPARRAPLHLRALNAGLVRPWLARRIEAQIRRRTRPAHYPAPFAILELWRKHGARGTGAYAAEARSIGHLLMTPTCKNLVRVFFLRERLRNLAPKAASTERLHVVGAGVMGGDIAAWSALRGLTVTLQDRAIEFVEPALKRARKLFESRLRAPGEAAAAIDRLVVDIPGAQVGTAEVVIEAIVERLDAKQGLFKQIEETASPDAILATNTSSIRLEDIAASMQRPERLLGLHFFNPVAKLPLVEVIRSEHTDEALLLRAMSFVTQIGKLPLPCRSAPGFVVNRILTPYMLEALRAHEDGYALETIDRAAESFGMPTGPVELADRVGLDIALHVIGILGATLKAEVPPALQQKVDAGELGAKTGRGFYVFENNRPRKARDVPAPDEELRDRLILAMVNESMACYEDGVVDDLDLLDAGVIFGAGFAPFRGGPVRYAVETGVARIVARLEDLAARHGPRFSPRPGWSRLLPEA